MAAEGQVAVGGHWGSGTTERAGGWPGLSAEALRGPSPQPTRGEPVPNRHCFHAPGPTPPQHGQAAWRKEITMKTET